MRCFLCPSTITLLSRESIEDDSLGNLYAAFENHPGKYSDPSGLDIKSARDRAIGFCQVAKSAPGDMIGEIWNSAIDLGGALYASYYYSDIQAEDYHLQSSQLDSFRNNYVNSAYRGRANVPLFVALGDAAFTTAVFDKVEGAIDSYLKLQTLARTRRKRQNRLGPTP